MALWALEVLGIALLLNLFATSHLLNSSFGRIGALEHHNLLTNVSPAGSLGTWETRLSVLATAALKVTGPCQLAHQLPLTNKGTLERLGLDEYRNVVDPFSSFVGIEKTELLERCYVDYFEGSESVIVKGRLKANVQFGKALVLLFLFSALLANPVSANPGTGRATGGHIGFCKQKYFLQI